ncbi:hypothetical protein [Desertivirga arenae]|uniref:hypothetical protein n=1 Tax=Desertivirga arenae TaxID=2810309 RepID=UPI001A96BC47|nr:hypothetical protein [Pedobacter sp. SYSU D00823]
MFFRLFHERTPHRLSKSDYWRKWELFELFKDLRRAEELLIEVTAEAEESIPAEFRDVFIEELGDLEGANIPDFTTIWNWFTPGREWDCVVGDKGKDLGRNIFRISNKWKRGQIFFPLTKVWLNGKYGVVLDRTEGNSLYGFIRWDSNKSEDIEDWRGPIGRFLAAGGEVISQDYEFEFINDDGSIVTGRS